MLYVVFVLPSQVRMGARMTDPECRAEVWAAKRGDMSPSVFFVGAYIKCPPIL